MTAHDKPPKPGEPGSVFSGEQAPPEDVKRAGKLAQERGWAERVPANEGQPVERQGIGSEPSSLSAQVGETVDVKERVFYLAELVAILVCVDDVAHVDDREGRRRLDRAANELGHLLKLPFPEFDTIWGDSATATAERSPQDSALADSLARVTQERDEAKDALAYAVDGLQEERAATARLDAALREMEDVARAAATWAPGGNKTYLIGRIEDVARLALASVADR